LSPLEHVTGPPPASHSRRVTFDVTASPNVVCIRMDPCRRRTYSLGRINLPQWINTPSRSGKVNVAKLEAQPQPPANSSKDHEATPLYPHHFQWSPVPYFCIGKGSTCGGGSGLDSGTDCDALCRANQISPEQLPTIRK